MKIAVRFLFYWNVFPDQIYNNPTLLLKWLGANAGSVYKCITRRHLGSMS